MEKLTKKILIDCKNDYEFFRLMDESRGRRDDQQIRAWKCKLNDLKNINGFNDIEIAEIIGVDNSVVYQWNKMLPYSKIGYVMLAAVFKMGVSEANHFIKHYSNYNVLNKHNPVDSACISFLANHSGNNAYIPFFDNISEELNRYIAVKTKDNFEPKRTVNSVRDLLSKGINNHKRLTKSIIEDDCFSEFIHDKGRFELFLDGNPVFPIREDLIAICLNLSYDIKAIDSILMLAEEEPLNVQNPYEAALVYLISSYNADRKIINEPINMLEDIVERTEGERFLILFDNYLCDRYYKKRGVL